jgi:diadenosine tetraphosphate (Ap4A) HIT family hydrolase
MTTTPCPFCDLDSDRTFLETDLVVGLWDKHPVSPGHALLVPRRHVASWFDATASEQRALVEGLEPAKAAILARYSPDGFNIGVKRGDSRPGDAHVSSCAPRRSVRPLHG